MGLLTVIILVGSFLIAGLELWSVCLDWEVKNRKWKIDFVVAISGIIVFFAALWHTITDSAEATARDLRITANESETAATIATEREKRIQIEAELAKAKRKLAKRTESVTEEQAQAFISALRLMPKAKCELGAFEDPETVEFGELVARILMAAEWPVTKMQRHNIWFPTHIGVHLEVRELPGPECCKLIVDEFSKIGIKDVRILVPERLPDEGTFRLFVGVKPLSAGD